MKRVVERSLVRAGVARACRHSRRADVLILGYHNVIPTGAPRIGDRSLHLPQRQFAAQLDSLRETHDVVPLAATMSDVRPATRPRAVVTFDDAYEGALTAGLAELRARAIPATIFVAPGLIGGRELWWDRLASPTGAGLAPAARAHALHQLAGEDARVIAWARESGLHLQTMPAYARIATAAALEIATSTPGITLASHSWSHPNLAALDEDARRRELSESIAWLKARFPRTVLPLLAYPYGVSSPAVERAAFEAGYEGALRIDGGWLGPHSPPPFAIPRLNVPSGVSLDGFRLRCAGLFCA